MDVMLLYVVVVMLLSYIIGSFPTGYVLGKVFRGIDIKERGSGNIGATNVLRILGPTLGIATLLIDLGKGVLAVYIAKLIIPEGSLYAGLWYILSGVSVLLGHTFSLWLNFRGGKGVAVTAGFSLYLMPGEVLLALIIFLITTGISRYVSLGSLISIISLPLLIYINLFNNPWSTYNIYFLVSIPLAVMIIVKHKENIKRIFSGQENKIFSKRD